MKQQVSTAVSNLHNAEAAAAAIAVPERNGDLDPAGWYTLATNVASTMGVQIEQTMEFNCGGQSGENPSGFVAAYYCQMPDRSQRNVVHILTTHPDWTQTARSPWLVDMVKHELSHRSIMISCGTTQPTIAADRTEAVTNSYSVLFFGADRDRILAAAGAGRRDLADRSVSQPLERVMESRKPYLSEGDPEHVLLPCEGSLRPLLCAWPIIAAGDVTGAVGLLAEDRTQQPDPAQQKAVAVAAAFLAKQMEE